MFFNLKKTFKLFMEWKYNLFFSYQNVLKIILDS